MIAAQRAAAPRRARLHKGAGSRSYAQTNVHGKIKEAKTRKVHYIFSRGDVKAPVLAAKGNSQMQNPIAQAFRALISLFVISFALIFLPAWTLHYWQGWTYLTVLMASISAIVVYLVRNDPALLARRVNNTEKELSQKFIHFGVNFVFLSVSVISALDHHFGWSAVPVYVVIVGDAMVALGMLIIFFVFRENSFTASTVQVASDQRVVSTGLYALVRHPMYVGGLLFIFGIPLALGSWWGLLTFVPLTLLIVWRILDEERFLSKNLSGYEEYRTKVKYRLIPSVW